MKISKDRKKVLIELLRNIPENQWDEIRTNLIKLQPKELEIYTYLQKLYEDGQFCLLATFKDETDEELDFIAFTDKRTVTQTESVWDNDKWWVGVLENNKESIAQLDDELLPIVQQFLKQILNK